MTIINKDRQLLRRVRAGQGQRRPPMHVFAGSGGRRDGPLPGGLHARLSARGTHGLHSSERFDEDAMPRRRFRLQLFHGAVERALQDESKRNHDRQHDQRDPSQRPGDDVENGDEQDRKQADRSPTPRFRT